MRHILLGCAAMAAVSFASPAAADTVSDWWEVGNRYYLQSQGMSGPRNPDWDRGASRAALAMFEAVNAIDRRYESYLNFSVGDPRASQDAAAATAAYTVLVKHFPANKSTLDESYTIAMAGMADAPGKTAGIAIGEAAAAAAMTAAGIDPAIPQPPYRPRTTPGEWIGASLPSIEPYMGAFKPWAIESAEALRSAPPPALTSEIWARNYEEVRRLGGRTSKDRTPVQTLMAKYRQAFDVSPTMRVVASAPGRTPVQNARMFALYHMAFDDAVMAMSAAKMHYNYWRPITAIRNGETDSNPATVADPAWVPLLPTPNFPEYPCGHCTVAAAIGGVMTAEVGERPKTGVRVSSLIEPNAAVQVLPTWAEWIQTVSDSRMYGGVHYRFSNEAGEEIGRRAAQAVLEKVARPLSGKSRR